MPPHDLLSMMVMCYAILDSGSCQEDGLTMKWVEGYYPWCGESHKILMTL